MLAKRTVRQPFVVFSLFFWFRHNLPKKILNTPSFSHLFLSLSNLNLDKIVISLLIHRNCPFISQEKQNFLRTNSTPLLFSRPQSHKIYVSKFQTPFSHLLLSSPQTTLFYKRTKLEIQKDLEKRRRGRGTRELKSMYKQKFYGQKKRGGAERKGSFTRGYFHMHSECRALRNLSIFATSS